MEELSVTPDLFMFLIDNAGFVYVPDR
jgi:hypothetical protein